MFSLWMGPERGTETKRDCARKVQGGVATWAGEYMIIQSRQNRIGKNTAEPVGTIPKHTRTSGRTSTDTMDMKIATMKNHILDDMLRPCPFCGGVAHMRYIYVHQVICENCGVSTSFYQDENDAVNAWNGRVKE